MKLPQGKYLLSPWRVTVTARVAGGLVPCSLPTRVRRGRGRGAGGEGGGEVQRAQHRSLFAPLWIAELLFG